MVTNAASASLDTTFIVGNRIILDNSSISGGLVGISWNNNTQFFNISNNYIRSIATSISSGSTSAINSLVSILTFKAGVNSNQYNSLVNNTLRFAITGVSAAYNHVGVNSDVTLDNRCNFINNLIIFPVTTYSSCRAFRLSGNPQISYNLLVGSSNINTGTAPVDASNISDVNTTYNVSNDGCLTLTSQRNTGHPDPIFTNLDLTRNDVGACGGSYNITSNFQTPGIVGSAKVHWLHAPRRVIQGATLSINGEGHDR